GRVDDHGHDGGAAAQLPERVAMRSVIAVVAPDAAHARGARRAGAPQPAYERVCERRAAVDHQLVAAFGHAQPFTVALVDLDALEREQRALEQRAELG